MPERPTFASVTDTLCRCGYLRRSADDPRSPIVFDRRAGEYQFRCRGADAEHFSMLVIYHCPFCGGAAPKSKRDSLFHAIPPEEERRLEALLDGVTTLRSAMRKLGKPDEDDPRGVSLQDPERGARPPKTQWCRTIRYVRLSKVADVSFTERSDGRAFWYLHGKPKKRGRK